MGFEIIIIIPIYAMAIAGAIRYTKIWVDCPIALKRKSWRSWRLAGNLFGN